MAPKTNKQREKLEQNQASSRAKAQETLRGVGGFVGFASFAKSGPSSSTTSSRASSSAAAANPFASFASSGGGYGGDEYGATAAMSAASSSSSAMYDGADHEIAMALKMLGKKGTVTKMKALNSFLHEILPHKKPLDIRAMVGHFVQLYTFEIRDQKDRKVRQLLNEVLLALMTKLKPKAFAPHLRRLMPYWLMAMHDPNSETAAAASKALEALFPANAEMQAEIIVAHLSATMEEYSTFFQHTPETFPGVMLSESDEREERYERCVAAAVLSIDKIVTLFAATRNLGKLHEQNKPFTVDGVVSGDKFGKLVAATSKHNNFSRDAIRQASYKTLKSLVDVAFADVIQPREEYFGKLILGALSDKYPMNQQAMWDMVLTFLQAVTAASTGDAHNSSLWTSASFPKFVKSAVLPRLFAQVRHGFYGSAKTSFPVLLPLLSMIPLQHVVDTKTGTCALYSGVVENAFKFLASNESRFYEDVVIASALECLHAFVDYFLRSPPNCAAANQLFGDDDNSNQQEMVAAYVGQFEKATKDALLTVFTLSRLTTRHVTAFATEWQSMATKLRAASDPVSSRVATHFVDASSKWLSTVLESLPSNASVEAHRVYVFLKIVVESTVAMSEEAKQSLFATSKRVYQSCLTQLTQANAASRALEIMFGLHEVVGAQALGLLDGQETVEQHYETHIRPLVVAAGAPNTLAPEGSNSSSSASVKIVLRVAKQFYSLVSDKKAFVLQLFQDFAVQYGDLEKAALVVETCFQYPFESSGASQWLASGSFHHTTTTVDDHTLSPVWKGRLLDEFVMISLKGRLDDLDADAFSSLLSSCLGGEESSMPVVSPDVVVILSHFAHQQQQRGQSHVAMRILPSVVRLFGRLNDDEDDALPRELRSAHEQLLMCLFHLAAKSNFKTEAETLWNQNVRVAIAKWSSERRLTFISSLADTINEVFASESKTSYSPKIWASYVELFLALASGREDHDDASPFALINRLTVFDLRFDGTRAQLTTLYDRLLSCLAELCDDDESGVATARVAGFVEELIARDEDRGLKLLRRVLDIDVCHGLTYAILQSESMAALSRDSPIAPLESVSLRPLYTSLALYLPRVLAAISGDQHHAKNETETPRYRKVLFMNQQTESGIVDDVDVLEDLTSDQHLRLDRLVAAVLVSLLPSSETRQHATTWLGQQRPIASSVAPIDRTVHILQSFEDAEAADVVSSVVARSAELLTQWPGLGGVQALKVFTSVWADQVHGFDASTHHPLLLKMSRSFAMASQTTLTEWLDAAAYLTAMPLAWTNATNEETADTLEDTKKRWSLAVRGLVTHALAGKQGMAAVAALRIHKRTLPATLDAEDGMDELTTVVEYPIDLVRSRRVAAQLAQVMASVDNGEPLRELATNHREALLSTLLVGLAESLAIKAKLVPTYLALHSPSKSLAVIDMSSEIDALLDATASALPVLLRVMTATSESDRGVKSLLLDAFVSLKGLAACFNSDKSHTPPHVRTLLYTICSTTGVFKPSTSAATNAGIDINADDEAATEAALAKSIIPAGLRAALKAAYPSSWSATAANASAAAKRTRRQHRRAAVADEEDDIVGRLLAWDLFVQLFPDSGSRDGGHLGMRSSALSAYVAKNGLLSSYLSLCGELLSRETGAQSLVARLTLRDNALYTLGELPSLESGADLVVSLAARSFFRTVLRLPAMVRTWWNDECSRSLRSWASKYFEEHITPYVLTSELEIIQKASETRSWDVEEMSVKGSKVSREITTTYVKDECALEMVIRVPASYPLRSVEVECTRRIGITEDRWRRWVLQIIKVTSAQDGSLLDAVLLWKQNVDKEFEGVEPCPICYSILNPKTMGLPSLSCKTCANKYHNSCLYKWFNQSGKNKCPICQQPFT